MRYLSLAVSWRDRFLPVATGAPEPATTVGKAQGGFTITGEAPTLDLIAKKTAHDADNDYTDTYGESPAAASAHARATASATTPTSRSPPRARSTYFFFPIPDRRLDRPAPAHRHGRRIRRRDRRPHRRRHAGLDYTDSNGNSTNNEASAEYGAVQGVIQLKHGAGPPARLAQPDAVPHQAHAWLGPGAEVHGPRILGHVRPDVRLAASASSARTSRSPTSRARTSRAASITSGGLMLAVRPDRNRHVEPPPPDVHARRRTPRRRTPRRRRCIRSRRRAAACRRSRRRPQTTAPAPSPRNPRT